MDQLHYRTTRGVDCYCFRCSFKYLGYIEVKPGIVDSELILTVTFRAFFNRRLVSPGKGAVWLVREFCPHQKADPNIAQLKCWVGDKYFLRCTFCRTEAALIFSRYGDCKFEVLVRVFRNVGDRRDPFHQWAKNVTKRPEPSLMEVISYRDLTYIDSMMVV